VEKRDTKGYTAICSILQKSAEKRKMKFQYYMKLHTCVEN